MRMRHVFGIALAGMMVLGMTPRARAQFGLSIGNPMTGRGVVIGNNPYGYGYGAPGTTVYSRGYSGLVGAPAATYYNPGYVAPAPVYGVARPVYGYRAVAPYGRPVYRNVYRGRGMGRRAYRW